METKQIFKLEQQITSVVGIKFHSNGWLKNLRIFFSHGQKHMIPWASSEIMKCLRLILRHELTLHKKALCKSKSFFIFGHSAQDKSEVKINRAVLPSSG